MSSSKSLLVALSLVASFTRTTALPQILDEYCATPTTTVQITATPAVPVRCPQCFVGPTRACAPGEPTASPPPVATLTASDLCTVTLSTGVDPLCGGCPTCSLALPTPTPSLGGGDGGVIANPGGPMKPPVARRQLPPVLPSDIPILDHVPGGPILGAITLPDIPLPTSTTLVVVKKRENAIRQGGGGPIITARQDGSPIHGGSPMITVTVSV